MGSITPDSRKIKSFRTWQTFETWLRANQERESEIWILIYKKATGRKTVTPAEALDVALCWGWIDAIRKSHDEESYLQRYCRRKPKSTWSQVNRENVARLVAAGRMTPQGRREVDAAMKTPAGRARKITQLVEMLARGETIVPERKPAARPRS